MTAKRFRVTISNTNAVSFVDVVENKQLMSITFKNKSDAIDCKNALMYQCELLNVLHEENEQLKSEYKVLHTQYQDLKKFVKNNFDEYLTQEKLNRQIIKLSEENEQLKQELWDISIDYFTETYSDNSIRRDEHINEFKKEFKAKYGDVE